jgi:hypothetical protein
MMAAWLVVMLQRLHTPLYLASVSDLNDASNLLPLRPFRAISKWSILQQSMSGFDG